MAASETGVLYNLTPDEERALQEAWMHLLRLCGTEIPDPSSEDGVPGRAPDRTSEFMKIMTDKSPENFKQHLLGFIGPEHPDGLVLRFLRARKWDVGKAMEMLVADINWRQEMRIDECIVAEGESVTFKETPTEDDKGFMMQYRSGKSFVRGTDKEGRPIYVIKVRLHDPKAQSGDSMETYVLHNIEGLRVLVRAPHDKTCLIFDMTGFGLKNMDFHVVKFLAQVFEARYPETLGVVLIHNAPFIFWGLWNIIKGWLDPVVASKINFTRSKADVEKWIDKDNMQPCYGGSDEWEYKYEEPMPGENRRMTEEPEKKAKLAEERAGLVRDFFLDTVEWAAKDPESPESKDIYTRRTKLADQLRTNYWVLDPYVRARAYYNRVGVVDGQGEVDFKAAGREKLTNGVTKVATNGSAKGSVKGSMKGLVNGLVNGSTNGVTNGGAH